MEIEIDDCEWQCQRTCQCMINQIERLTTENSELRGLLREAMEWNWSEDDFHNIPQDVVARCTKQAWAEHAGAVVTDEGKQNED